jgi:HTH-type transcriptional regulator/antitoxin HigA
MGALAIDPKRYARLLSKTLPRVIDSDTEYERVLQEIERLMDKSTSRTPEEDALLRLMVSLVETYEQQHYALPQSSPREILVYLMEQRGLKQSDLVPIFKSRGYVSDVVNGKRNISKTHARQLAGLFRVSAELFI